MTNRELAQEVAKAVHEQSVPFVGRLGSYSVFAINHGRVLARSNAGKLELQVLKVGGKPQPVGVR